MEGTTTAVSWIDEAGESRTTDYVVPHEGECVTRHQADESAVFIGPTPRNLNRFVERDGNDVNQLAYFQAEGVLSEVDDASVATIPNYEDGAESLAERARISTSTARSATALDAGMKHPGVTSTSATQRRSSKRVSTTERTEWQGSRGTATCRTSERPFFTMRGSDSCSIGMDSL